MPDYSFYPLSPQYDADIARLIRSNLKACHLDIPGTAYFDEELDHLSDFYAEPGRTYYVLTDGGVVIGGIGMAEFEGFESCAELQKLYLDDSAKGHGLGYRMIAHIEDCARKHGYMRMYLETHTNLQAALHIYEKSGYKTIPRPESVVHSTMNRFFFKELK